MIIKIRCLFPNKKLSLWFLGNVVKMGIKDTLRMIEGFFFGEFGSFSTNLE
jgi:hypothetical protein